MIKNKGFNKRVLYEYQGRTQVGGQEARVPLGPNFFFFLVCLVIICLIFVVEPGSLPKPQITFSSISLTNLIQIATFKSKNLTKSIKTFTMVIVFQQPKKKKILLKNQKKSCVIGEVKTKFFTIIPVDCNKLLKLKYNILLRLYLFIQLKNSNSSYSFIILISCLYYFR